MMDFGFKSIDVSNLGWTLVHSLWQLALLAAALGILHTQIPKSRARARYLSSVFAMAMATIVPFLTWVHISSETPLITTPVSSTERTPQSAIHSQLFDAPQRLPVPSSGDAKPLSYPNPSMETAESTLESAFPWICLVWLIGFALFSLRPLVGYAFGLRICARRNIQVCETLDRRAKDLAQKVGIRKYVKAALSSRVDVPLILGFIRPVILFPMSAVNGLSPRELDTILLHELAHLKRWDYVVNFAQNIIEALFFYHPGVWWMSLAIRREREACCDDQVLQYCPNPSIYLRALSRLEEGRSSPVAWGLAASGGSLLDRAKRIASWPHVHARPTLFATIVWIASALVPVATLGSAFAKIENPNSVQDKETVKKPDEETDQVTDQEIDLSLSVLRERNEETYQRVSEELKRDHFGHWMIIIRGEVEGPFDTFDDAVARADRIAEKDPHRYIFRPGVDDYEGEFRQSPWMNSDPSWYQFGLTFRKSHPFGISSTTWSHKDKSMKTRRDGRGWVSCSAPGETPHRKFAAVISSLFEYDLTIRDNDAKALGLERYSVPGTMQCRAPKKACRKVRIRVGMNELGLDTSLVAIVFPSAEDDMDPKELLSLLEGVLVPIELDEPIEPVEPVKTDDGYSVYGTISDPDGKPLEGVRLRVMTGIATLFESGSGLSDKDGQYKVEFNNQGFSAQTEDVVYAATVFASLEGHSEKNLCRAGDCRMASRPPGDGTGVVPDNLILQGVPRRIDFVMAPAATIEGYLIDSEGIPIALRSIDIDGETLPPSCSVLDSVSVDERGFFRIDAVPTRLPWFLSFRIPNSRIEVQSLPLSFETPSLHRILITLASDWSGIQVEALSRDTEQEILKEQFERLSSESVEGKLPDDTLNGLIWGEAKDGLQAAIRFTAGKSRFEVGEQISFEFIVKNSSDQTRVVPSTSFRQEDRLRMRKDQNSPFLDVSQTWYSGFPMTQRHKLDPGEYSVIQSGSIGIEAQDQSDFPHPVVYRVKTEPGVYQIEFRLRFPDIRRDEADTQGEWNGTLYTGENPITIDSR